MCVNCEINSRTLEVCSTTDHTTDQALALFDFHVKVTDLSSPPNTFPDTEVDEDPGDGQSYC